MAGNQIVKFDNVPTTIEENISVTYGCFQFFDNFGFFLSRLDSLVTTRFDDNHKLLKKLIEEVFADDVLLNFVNEIETLISRDRFDDDSFGELKKGFPYEI